MVPLYSQGNVHHTLRYSSTLARALDQMSRVYHVRTEVPAFSKPDLHSLRMTALTNAFACYDILTRTPMWQQWSLEQVPGKHACNYSRTTRPPTTNEHALSTKKTRGWYDSIV